MCLNVWQRCNLFTNLHLGSCLLRETDISRVRSFKLVFTASAKSCLWDKIYGGTSIRVPWRGPKGKPVLCSHGPRCVHTQHTTEWQALTWPENTDKFALGYSHCSSHHSPLVCKLLTILRNVLFHGALLFLRSLLQGKDFEPQPLEPLVMCMDKTFFLPVWWRSEKFEASLHKAKERLNPKPISVFHSPILAFLNTEDR